MKTIIKGFGASLISRNYKICLGLRREQSQSVFEFGRNRLVTQGNISSQFTSNSVDIKVKDYKGLNWRFSIKKTFDELKDKGCTLKTTNNSIVLNLIKKHQKNWDQLNFKEKLIDTDPSKLDKQDPQASLMNMMKEMYQNGDEDMKRTIAQAWSKSQEEKGLQ